MADTIAETAHSALSGVARVLVHAGKLSEKSAAGLVKAAGEKKTGFVAELIKSGAVSPVDLAHTLGLEDVRFADWSDFIAPFWPAVFRSALKPKNFFRCASLLVFRKSCGAGIMVALSF